MIYGYGSKLEKEDLNFTSVGTPQAGQQFSAATVPLLRQVNTDNLAPLAQDTVQTQIPQQPQAAMPEEGMLGDLKYTIPLWFVLGKGVDLYNNKCSGDYATSLPAKIGRLGDKIANSKVAKSDIVQNVGNKISTAGRVATERWRNNSNIIRNLMEHTTLPENEMAKATMYTQTEELASEVNHLFESYTKNTKLRHMAPSKAEKEFLKVLGKDASTIDKVHALQLHRSNPTKFKDAASIRTILSQRATNPNIIKETLLKEVGCDLATFQKYTANPTKYTKELRDIAIGLGKDVKLYKGNYLGVGPIFRRKLDMSQIGNKMLSVAKDAVDATGAKLPPKTALGRGMSQTMQGIMRGMTFGGGKLGLLIFVAPALVDMIKNAKEAPDDQKLGTIAYGSVEAISWVATFPLSMKLMHKIGGLRYLGMTKEQVAAYRDALKTFNEKNASGAFKTLDSYKNAWQKVKAMRTPSTKLNIFEKALKGLGFAITQDLEMRHSWKNPNLKGVKSVANFFRGKRVGNFFRHGVGTVGKLGLFGALMMGVLSPMISKPIEWIFGKHYDRHEEAEKRAAAEAANTPASPMPMTQPTQGSEVAAAIDAFNSQMANKTQAPQSNDVTNAIDAFNAKMAATPVANGAKVESQALAAQKDSYSYVPSQTCDIPRDSGEFNERTYMPSQECQVVQFPEDLSGINMIEQRANLAESNALDVLSRKV